jgi:hypothetical protein
VLVEVADEGLQVGLLQHRVGVEEQHQVGGELGVPAVVAGTEPEVGLLDEPHPRHRSDDRRGGVRGGVVDDDDRTQPTDREGLQRRAHGPLRGVRHHHDAHPVESPHAQSLTW